MSDFFVATENDGSQWVTLENYLELEKKFREFTDYVYEIVSVQCDDVGETHAGMQSEVESIRQSGLTKRAADGGGVAPKNSCVRVLGCVFNAPPLTLAVLRLHEVNMSKVIDEVRHKVACGQNLFRRSTIEKMLAEYDRLLMRNTALEKNAVEHKMHPTAAGVESASQKSESGGG